MTRYSPDHMRSLSGLYPSFSKSYMRSVSLFVLLFFYLAGHVTAQNRLVFETLNTVGPIPSANFSIARPVTEINGFSVDAIGQRVHWILGQDWYRLDLKTRTWTRHFIQNGFDLHLPRWGVIPGTSDLLVWDAGVGRVIRIDSNGVGTRIDQSFDQKTQFSHLQHIEPDGSIYAIGGSGLHHPKNYAVAFSNASRGWHRVAGMDLISSDPYLQDGLVLNDPSSDHILLFTGYAFRQGHSDHGILSMNWSTGKISVIHSTVPTLALQQIGLFRFQHSSSVHTGEHGFGFVRSGREKQNERDFHLTAISFDSHRITDVVGSITNDLDPSVNHLVLHYSEDDSSLYSVQWSHLSTDVVSIAVLQRAKVDVDAMHTALAKGKAPDKPKVSSNNARPVWPWQAALGVSLVLLVGLWIRFRRYSPEPILPDASLTMPSVMLKLDLDPVRVNGNEWTKLFSATFTLEGQLLDLLTRSTLEGRPVVSSDTIDRMLIPNHPSPDYIRKTRNLTRKRLEESLQSVQPLPSGECYILTDRDVTDKRKTKLQLNTAWISVNPPG